MLIISEISLLLPRVFSSGDPVLGESLRALPPLRYQLVDFFLKNSRLVLLSLTAFTFLVTLEIVALFAVLEVEVEVVLGSMRALG